MLFAVTTRDSHSSAEIVSVWLGQKSFNENIGTVPTRSSSLRGRIYVIL